MHCIISGLETTNKYKNNPIHPDVIELAKMYGEMNGTSLSNSLIAVASHLFKDIKEKLDEHDQCGRNSTEN